MFYYLINYYMFHRFTDYWCQWNRMIVLWIRFLACFHWDGIVPVYEDCLNMWVSIGEILAAVILNTSGCTESGPGDFDESQLVRMLKTPCLVISKDGWVRCTEGPLSGMLLLSSIVKMDLNCSFRIVAFSIGLVIEWAFLGFISVPIPLFSCFRLFR